MRIKGAFHFGNIHNCHDCLGKLIKNKSNSSEKKTLILKRDSLGIHIYCLDGSRQLGSIVPSSIKPEIVSRLLKSYTNGIKCEVVSIAQTTRHRDEYQFEFITRDISFNKAILKERFYRFLSTIDSLIIPMAIIMACILTRYLAYLIYFSPKLRNVNRMQNAILEEIKMPGAPSIRNLIEIYSLTQGDYVATRADFDKVEKILAKIRLDLLDGQVEGLVTSFDLYRTSIMNNIDQYFRGIELRDYEGVLTQEDVSAFRLLANSETLKSDENLSLQLRILMDRMIQREINLKEMKSKNVWAFYCTVFSTILAVIMAIVTIRVHFKKVPEGID